MYRLHPLDQAAAREIANWHYDAPYSFYDMEQDPEDLAEFLEPANWPGHYFSASDQDGNLVGFFSFAPNEGGDSLEIGLGLRPDLTGRGMGLAFLEAGLAFARERWGSKPLTLAVAAFNQRAIRLYERAGFEITGQYTQQTNGGEHPFVAMKKS